LVAASSAAFLIDLLFTLVRDDLLDAAAPVATRLAAVAPDDARALLARADLALHVAAARGDAASRERAGRLLRRCVAVGDSLGRCARLAARLGRRDESVTTR